MSRDDLPSLLRENPAPVRYDAQRGLARHQRLVEAGTPLPEWAHELKPRARWLPRLAWLTGVLALSAALTAAIVWTSLPVAAPRAANVASAPKLEPRVESLAVPPVVTSTAAPKPQVEPLAPHREDRVQPVVTPIVEEQPAAVETVERATSRERAAHSSRGSARHTIENDPVTLSERKAEIVKPQDNAELAQLADAERALPVDPVRALKLAREGELAFKNGYFVQERRYIEVMALFSLGRLGEAHAEAAGFLRDFPNAPYRRKVELEMLRQPQH